MAANDIARALFTVVPRAFPALEMAVQTEWLPHVLKVESTSGNWIYRDNTSWLVSAYDFYSRVVKIATSE